MAERPGLPADPKSLKLCETSLCAAVEAWKDDGCVGPVSTRWEADTGEPRDPLPRPVCTKLGQLRADLRHPTRGAKAPWSH